MSWQKYVFVVLLWPLIGSPKHVHSFSTQRKNFELHLGGFLLVVVVLLVVAQVRDQPIQAIWNSDPQCARAQLNHLSILRHKRQIEHEQFCVLPRTEMSEAKVDETDTVRCMGRDELGRLVWHTPWQMVALELKLTMKVPAHRICRTSIGDGVKKRLRVICWHRGSWSQWRLSHWNNQTTQQWILGMNQNDHRENLDGKSKDECKQRRIVLTERVKERKRARVERVAGYARVELEWPTVVWKLANHPTFSLIARDMQRSSHLSDLPSQGRMIASAAWCPMVLLLGWRFVCYFLVWLNRNFWMTSSCSGPQLILVQKPVTREVPRRPMQSASDSFRTIIERNLTGKARISAYKDRIAATERVKERKRAQVDRGARDVLLEPGTAEQVADRHAVACGEKQKQHEESIMRDVHIGRRGSETTNEEQHVKLKKTIRFEQEAPKYIVVLIHACVSWLSCEWSETRSAEARACVEFKSSWKWQTNFCVGCTLRDGWRRESRCNKEVLDWYRDEDAGDFRRNCGEMRDVACAFLLLRASRGSARASCCAPRHDGFRVRPNNPRPNDILVEKTVRIRRRCGRDIMCPRSTPFPSWVCAAATSCGLALVLSRSLPQLGGVIFVEVWPSPSWPGTLCRGQPSRHLMSAQLGWARVRDDSAMSHLMSAQRRNST